MIIAKRIESMMESVIRKADFGQVNVLDFFYVKLLVQIDKARLTQQLNDYVDIINEGKLSL